MTEWTFTAVWDAISGRLPNATALVHGATRSSWAQFERNAAGLAGFFQKGGVTEGASVAQYLYNHPAYLESVYASFKLGATPINTNYRYSEREICSLWDDADVTAVVFHDDFTEVCEALRRKLPQITSWIWVGSEGSDRTCPPWATPYGEGIANPRVSHRAPLGDDLFLLYTGGTTGLPKGVMWRQDDLFKMIESPTSKPLPEDGEVDSFVRTIEGPGQRMLVAAPLMHGTALWLSMATLNHAGSVTTLVSEHFDPVQVLNTATDQRSNSICIVGDAFARPMVSELGKQPDRYDLSALRAIVSSGVMFSAEVKDGLLSHAPRALIIDTLGSSESGVLARSTSRPGELAATARFVATASTRVIDEQGRDVIPGSGQSGRLAITGNIPLGYHKDPEKTASTFLTLDGVRYVVAGDWATIEPDGSISLLGRGSGCINTGGEKVFPEEVEESIKGMSQVADAAVVGLPNERFGAVVTALVVAVDGASLEPADVVDHVRSEHAAYKAPRNVFVVSSLDRAPNGKLDYLILRTRALEMSRSRRNAEDGAI